VNRDGLGAQRGFEADWRERFARYAQLHDDDAGIAGWTPTGLAARIRFFQRHWLGGRAGGLWVDAGCGAGTYSRWLAEAGQEVVGLDYSLPTLVKARERSSPAIRWVVGDATSLPLQSASTDGALCLGVSQALASSGSLAEELARVVRPGGTVWVDGLNGWCLPHLWERLRRRFSGRPPRVRFESPWRLRRLVRRAGFADARLHWLPILPASLSRFQRVVESPPAAVAFRLLPPVAALFSHSMVIIGRRQEGPHAG
jgi:SAM-dependent methyltransferase